MAAIPPAVAGQRGHDQTFSVAVALVHGFALPENEAWPILCDYSARCLPPWSEAELRHKLASAGKLTRHPKPQGHLLGRFTWGTSPRHDRPEPAPRRALGRVAMPDVPPAPPTPDKVNLPDRDTPPPAPERPTPELSRHAAEQLGRIHKAGWISGPDDPDARTFAAAFMLFEATAEI